MKIEKDFMDAAPVVAGWRKTETTDDQGVDPARNQSQVLPAMMLIVETVADDYVEDCDVNNNRKPNFQFAFSSSMVQ